MLLDDADVYTHTHTGDTEAQRLWKFAQRSVQTFLTSHGVHFTIDNQEGTQVVSVGDDGDNGVDDSNDDDADDSVSRAIEGNEHNTSLKHYFITKMVSIPIQLNQDIVN